VVSSARSAVQALEGRLGKKARSRLRIAKWIVLLISPVWLINLAVAFLGHSVVFPLSPFFLREKLSALGSYAAHRPFCLLFDHPEIDPLIAKAEARNRLPRGLLAAVVQVESAGRPHRISSAGAMGPAQLMPSTARRLGVSDPFDTTASVDAAGRLLADHMARFKNIRLAVAAYNAGPGAVGRGVPQNGQTPAYVAKVMAAFNARRAAARRPALSVTP
jgi:soluble lytic murein transglycosylase-like protein